MICVCIIKGIMLQNVIEPDGYILNDYNPDETNIIILFWLVSQEPHNSWAIGPVCGAKGKAYTKDTIFIYSTTPGKDDLL